MNCAKGDSAGCWEQRLAEYLKSHFETHEVLSKFHRRASTVLHGSTTMGIDDECSDLDLWFLLPEADLAELDAVSRTRFFAIEVDGKEGHLNAEPLSEFTERFHRCHMDRVFQLRNAIAIFDETGCAERLITAAQNPMRPEVGSAFFFYHYVEMRGEHRACDNPMNRHDPVALLLSLPKVVAHALRAAITLDGEPYPYDKWLYWAAQKTPTGRLIVPHVERIVGLLSQGLLRFEGNESDHPISLELKKIRSALIESSRAKGNDAPWLIQWWRYMNQARDAIQDVRWA